MNRIPTLIVNTIGEPGSGKTTLSFWLSQALKKAGVATEFVPEVVKYECFDESGQARVRSGRFDYRYLATQARFLRPLMGKVEVVVNDGAYELFHFYAKNRMTPEASLRFRSKVDELRQQANLHCTQWFVMPQRNHRYDTLGRNENETEALALREAIRSCLTDDFSETVRLTPGDEEKEKLLQDILAWVHSQRALPAP